MPTRWTLNERWGVAVRPEVFWDRDGRWTLFRQTVKAFTMALEYRVPFRWTNTIFRLEHRWDDSPGPEGGFFRGAEISPGVVGSFSLCRWWPSVYKVGIVDMARRVLIVDDEENIRRVTRLTLEAAGYEVGEAEDGERGLEAFGDGSSWDAVLH
jgi:hypothetical protein